MPTMRIDKKPTLRIHLSLARCNSMGMAQEKSRCVVSRLFPAAKISLDGCSSEWFNNITNEWLVKFSVRNAVTFFAEDCNPLEMTVYVHVRQAADGDAKVDSRGTESFIQKYFAERIKDKAESCMVHGGEKVQDDEKVSLEDIYTELCGIRREIERLNANAVADGYLRRRHASK